MVSEAAVIRAEMNQTRGELDRKITELEVRARDFTPRAVAKRYLSENALDYAIGGILTLVGTRMAWRQLHARPTARRVADDDHGLQAGS